MDMTSHERELLVTIAELCEAFDRFNREAQPILVRAALLSNAVDSQQNDIHKQ